MSRLKKNPGYRAIHYWVESKLGKPSTCSACGSVSRNRYHWANISGKYEREISDWIRLCVVCHKAFDRRKRNPEPREMCSNGHRLTLDNIYLRRDRRHFSKKYIECRRCKQLTQARYINRTKELVGYET